MKNADWFYPLVKGQLSDLSNDELTQTLRHYSRRKRIATVLHVFRWFRVAVVAVGLFAVPYFALMSLWPHAEDPFRQHPRLNMFVASVFYWTVFIALSVVIGKTVFTHWVRELDQIKDVKLGIGQRLRLLRLQQAERIRKRGLGARSHVGHRP